MNLLARKSQIELASQGIELLKSKRDALVREFFSIVKSLLASREELEEVSHRAYHSLVITKAIDGVERLQSAASAGKREVFLDIDKRSVWGVTIPHIEKMVTERSLFDRGYNFMEVNSRIDAAATRFEIIIDTLIELASTEILLRKLGNEIKKTTRRVNALEQVLVPKLKAQVGYIRTTLEQREREDVFRLKRIKSKKFT